MWAKLDMRILQRLALNKPETASDATNMFGIVLIRRFKIITKIVRQFPTNTNNTIRTYKPDSTITLALLYDLNSVDISASWSSDTTKG